MKLVGYVNGIEVAFDFYPPNTWKVIVSADITGRFVIQLKAIDEAGNSTSAMYVYVYIDFKNMVFKVLDEKYGYEFNSKNYCYGIIDNEYTYDLIDFKYINRTLPQKYSYKKLVI